MGLQQILEKQHALTILLEQAFIESSSKAFLELEKRLSSSNQNIVNATKVGILNKLNNIESNLKKISIFNKANSYSYFNLVECILQSNIRIDIFELIPFFNDRGNRELARVIAKRDFVIDLPMRLMEPLNLTFNEETLNIEIGNRCVDIFIQHLIDKNNPIDFISYISEFDRTNSQKTKIADYLNESNRFGVTNFRKIVKSSDLEACRKAIDLGAIVTERDIKMAKNQSIKNLLEQNITRSFWSNLVKNSREYIEFYI